MEIKQYRAVNRGQLKAYVSVFIPSVGMEIRDIAVFQKDGEQWVRLPSREYENSEGEIKRTNIIAFPDKAVFERFSQALKTALHTYEQQHARDNEPPYMRPQ